MMQGWQGWNLPQDGVGAGEQGFACQGGDGAWGTVEKAVPREASGIES